MIDAIVRAAINSVFDGRVYANTFPQTEAGTGLSRLPAARFQIISAVNAGTVCGTDDRSTDDTRVQIDVVAGDWDSLMTKVDETIAAFIDSDPPCTRENYFTTFDVETRTHRASIDFVFYPSSAVTS